MNFNEAAAEMNKGKQVTCDEFDAVGLHLQYSGKSLIIVSMSGQFMGATITQRVSKSTSWRVVEREKPTGRSK